MARKIVLILFLINFIFPMQAKNTSKIIAHTIRLKPHQDVRLSLEQYIKEHNINAACILSAVGSLETACIRYANQKNTDTLQQFFEVVSLVGTLSANSGVHLHISISDSSGNTKGGHMQAGNLVYTTLEIVLAELPNSTYLRTLDATYGYKELEVK
jgi:uncharacterized protein